MDSVWILTRTQYRGTETDEHVSGVFASREAIERWLDATHGNLVEWSDVHKSYLIAYSTLSYRPEPWDVTE